MESVEKAFFPVQNIVYPPQKTVLRTPMYATVSHASNDEKVVAMSLKILI